MQRLFHKEHPDSPLVERPVPDLEALLAGPGFIWLDVAAATSEEIRELGETFDLDRMSLEEAIDISLLPRTDEFEKYVFVVLNGLVPAEGQRLATAELDLFIGKQFLVTIHREPFPAVEWLHNPTNSASTTNLDTPARLAAFIAQLGTRRYLPLIEALDERVDSLEELAMASDPRTLTEVHALRRDVGLLRRVVAPQRDVFNELAESLHPAIDIEAARAFDRVFDHHLKLIDSLDAARNLLTSVLETHRGAVADQTNEIVRILTVFSAVLLPMGVIAGMWGMNFVEVPGAGWEWGFYALVGAMLLLGLGLWIYFSRRGFIGGPRLRDLPRSVGLGLLQIGTAPIRLVGTGIESTVRQVGRIVSDPSSSRTRQDGDGDRFDPPPPSG